MKFLACLLFAANLPAVSLGRAVFAHYMVGGISQEHAAKDMRDAKAMGLDAFAINLGNPQASFVPAALSNMFNAAKSENFKLFLSMDLYAAGNACSSNGQACNGPNAYSDVIRQYRNSGAWYAGPNGAPMVSTFNAQQWTKDTFSSWRGSLGFPIYFIPDFDDTQGYYQADGGWWNYWGGVVDGLFSWESTWPKVGAKNDGDVSLDNTVKAGAKSRGKSYMAGLSMLQYKDSYGVNAYRRGELNLPKRMEGILGMSPLPEFVEIITWNDAPESHYIGNIWSEANFDPEPQRYINVDHTAIQPLLTSFINAYKAGVSAAQMKPVGSGNTGAMWYKTTFQGVQCPEARPAGGDAGQDVLNYAVVLPQGTTDSIQLYSGGGSSPVNTIKGRPGLNYGQSTVLNSGSQWMKVGGVSTSGGRCMNADCTDGFYNYNPTIVKLQPGGQRSACL